MSAFSAFALWYPAERIATMNGVAFASGMLGALIATVPLEMLLRVLHWREVFGGIVGITVAVSLLIFIAVPERTAARRGESLAAQWRGFAQIARDPGFWRAALCIGASQSAAVSLATLWVATWLRDVVGYSPAGVARALLAFALAMLVGYIHPYHLDLFPNAENAYATAIKASFYGANPAEALNEAQNVVAGTIPLRPATP